MSAGKATMVTLALTPGEPAGIGPELVAKLGSCDRAARIVVIADRHLLAERARRIDELVVTCAQLKEENRSLRSRQDSLIGERATLLQKNEQVRSRVEAMIGRLKAMEHSA